MENKVDTISSREDFVCFVRDLLQGYRHKPDAWENRDLETYLEAIAAWVEDMDGYYGNRGEPVPPQPSWKLFGEVLSGMPSMTIMRTSAATELEALWGGPGSGDGL